MTATLLLVGNWKMNLGVSASREIAEISCCAADKAKRSEVWIAPSSICIPTVVEVCKGRKVRIGAQNVHGSEKGAFTGELSASMLLEAGCSFAITGHSERRHIFGENSEQIAERTCGALARGLKIIFCVGEKIESRTSGQTMQVVAEQLAPLIKKLDRAHLAQLIIAYEPVWAIGTGKVASIQEIDQTHLEIIAHWKNTAGCDAPPVLYGGSVDPDNIGAIVKLSSVSGCLIGGASIHPQKLPALIEISETSATQ